MLYPHQERMVEMLKGGSRYVVAGPRVGKSRPVISFLGSGNVLVLTKKAAIGGWEKELCALGVTGWTVTNYEKVRTKGWDMAEGIEMAHRAKMVPEYKFEEIIELTDEETYINIRTVREVAWPELEGLLGKDLMDMVKKFAVPLPQ